MGEREHSFEHEGRSRAAAADADNAAVAAQLRAGALLAGGAGAMAAPGRELERAEAAGARAEALLALVREALLPAYRRAVDALDPIAALELARHVVGSMEVAREGRREVVIASADPDRHRVCAPAAGAVDGAGTSPGETAEVAEVAEAAVEARLGRLAAHRAALQVALPALERELAVQLGPQVLRGRPVLGEIVPPALGTEPTAYLAYEAGQTVELLGVVHEVRERAGARPGTCPQLTEAEAAELAALIEPWRGRPVSFAFLARALAEESIWEAIATARGGSGRTLEETSAAVVAQAAETGALADVGELDTARLHALFGIDPTDPSRFEHGAPDIDDATAMRVYELLGAAAPDARGPLIRQIAGMRELGALCSHLPWRYVEALHDAVADRDPAAAELLRPHFEDRGGGRSVHRMYMERVEGHLAEDQPIRAFGWFFLDFVHNAVTGGFQHEYSAAYDAREDGLLTDDQFASAATKALGKAALVTAVSAVTGGVAGELASGFAAGLGAGRSAAQLIGGGVGGFAGGVGGHLAADVYDQMLSGKPGFDGLGDYLRSGALGGGAGTVLAGVSVGAGRYLGGAQRPLDAFAARHPRLAHVLEDIRGAGLRGGAGVRMKVAELLELIGSGFGGPGGPTAFAYAHAGGRGDVRALPLDTEIAVAMRPVRPLTQPMQASQLGEAGEAAGRDAMGADATDAAGADAAGAKVEAESQVVAIERVEVVEAPPAGRPAADGRALPPAEWLERLRAQLSPEELAQLERMQGKWATPERMQEAFGGDFDAARAAVAEAAGAKAGARALREASQRRAEEIRAFVQARGILQQEAAVAILERLPARPTADQIATAVHELRPLVIGELQAEANAMRYPGAKVLRDVKVLVEQPQISKEGYRQLSRADKRGLQTRSEPGGDRIYRTITDIDSLVLDARNGKATILRVEQQKTGVGDKHAKAQAQNELALRAIDTARAEGRSLRLEIEGNIDVADQIDLATAKDASQVTVGPAGKDFDESIGITALDLERLMKELVENIASTRGHR